MTHPFLKTGITRAVQHTPKGQPRIDDLARTQRINADLARALRLARCRRFLFVKALRQVARLREGIAHD